MEEKFSGAARSREEGERPTTRLEIVACLVIEGGVNRQRGRPNYYTSGKIWGPLFWCRLPEENMGFRFVVQVGNPTTCTIKKSNPHSISESSGWLPTLLLLKLQELFRIFILRIQWP